MPVGLHAAAIKLLAGLAERQQAPPPEKLHTADLVEAIREYKNAAQAGKTLRR